MISEATVVKRALVEVLRSASEKPSAPRRIVHAGTANCNITWRKYVTTRRGQRLSPKGLIRVNVKVRYSMHYVLLQRLVMNPEGVP